MTDPWDERYIYLLISHKNQATVGKYTSPMDPMGTNIFAPEMVGRFSRFLSGPGLPSGARSRFDLSPFGGVF